MVKKAQHTPPMTTSSYREATVEKLIAGATKRYGEGYVSRSENTRSSYLLRRPTGLVSLDIAMAGGFPAAAPSVLVGPDGAGKDYLLWCTLAEAQRTYGKEFCAAVYFTEFRPDKPFMKDICGFQIAFSEEEIEELDQVRRVLKRPKLSAAEIDHYRKQIGTFVPIMGLSADKGFDEVFNFLEANVCQVIAVNSIGALQTEAKELVDNFEDFAQQRNEASLLSKAMPKFAMYMNRTVDGIPNETSLILVNQVRAKDQAARPMKGRPPSDKDQYKTASNAWALKHLKALEVFLHNGARIYDESASPPLVLGRKKQWEITKGKLGTHEGIKGEFSFFFGQGADRHGDLLHVALELGLVQQSGSWISYEESGFAFKAQGLQKAVMHLHEGPDLFDHLRLRCVQEAGILFRQK